MANTATVIGQGGATTVTLNWQTASNAAIAQKALGVITGAVTAGTMQEVSYTGGSTLPANPSIPSVVLAEGAGSAAHGPVQLGGNYQVGISNDTSATPAPQGWVVPFTAGNSGAASDTVFVGGGGGQVVNFGANTQVFLSGQGPQALQEIGLVGATISPSAQVWMDGNGTVDGSAGSTTIHLDTVPGVVTVTAFGNSAAFATNMNLTNNGNGTNIIDIATSTLPAGAAGATTINGAQSDVIFINGSSTVATTINAAGSAASGAAAAGTTQPVLWVVDQGAPVVVDGGASQVIAFSSGLGSMSVNGGTGSHDIAVIITGSFKAGTGGGALMAGAANNAATLQGGGDGDIMWALGSKNTLIGGAGNEIQGGFSGGVTFEGNLGAGASTTNMIANPGFGGHDTFVTGHNTNLISAQSDTVGGNTFKEGVAGSASDVATINGFNVGADTVSLANPAGGNYSTVTGTTPNATQIGVSVTGGNTVLNFGDKSTWTIVGVTTNIHFG